MGYLLSDHARTKDVNLVMESFQRCCRILELCVSNRGTNTVPMEFPSLQKMLDYMFEQQWQNYCTYGVSRRCRRYCITCLNNSGTATVPTEQFHVIAENNYWIIIVSVTVTKLRYLSFMLWLNILANVFEQHWHKLRYLWSFPPLQKMLDYMFEQQWQSYIPMEKTTERLW